MRNENAKVYALTKNDTQRDHPTTLHALLLVRSVGRWQDNGGVRLLKRPSYTILSNHPRSDRHHSQTDIFLANRPRCDHSVRALVHNAQSSRIQLITRSCLSAVLSFARENSTAPTSSRLLRSETRNTEPFPSTPPASIAARTASVGVDSPAISNVLSSARSSLRLVSSY